MAKIYDIVPPNSKKEEGVRVSKKPKTGKKVSLKFLTPIIIVLLVVLGIFFFMEGSASVKVYPVVDNVSFDETIYILPEEANIDLEENIIPGEYFEETLFFENMYDATGFDESAEKATGTITVCNEHQSGNSLKLVKKYYKANYMWH